MTVTALDLFAGTGWGVACQRLGIDEYGVEIMPEAVATRTANGMSTLYHDVWDGLLDDVFGLQYDMLIASPPCQTFSMAGSGAGRRAFEDVLHAIEAGHYKRPKQLIEFGKLHDPRTALVLAPLAYIWRDRPEYVVLEQVPTVLPVWEAYAVVMRGWGYDVQVANLHSEQYGVPQTRKRAVLVAHLGGPVGLPVPTHSRYYTQDPYRLADGVTPWRSMRDVLGVSPGRAVLRSNYGTGGDPAARGHRSADQPAFTVTSKVNRNKWNDGSSVTVEQASALQTYPEDFLWAGSATAAFLQVGNAVPPLLAQRILEALLA